MMFFHRDYKLNIKNFLPKIKKYRPIYRLNDFITAIITAISTAITAIVPSAAGATSYLIAANIVLLAKIAIIGSALWASMSQKSRGNKNFQETGGVLLNTMSSSDPIRPLYGEIRSGGTIVAVHTTGSKNKYLYVVVCWGEGGLQGIEGIKTDGSGEIVWLDDHRIQYYQTWHGQSLVDHEFHSGTPDQGVSSLMHAGLSSWNDPMQYTCYSVFKIKYNMKAFSSLPTFTALIKGTKLYDPRDNSISFSQNGALVWRDFKTNPIYGAGIPGSLITKQSAIDCANWLQTNSYYFDGVIAERQSYADNNADILLNLRAEVSWGGGEYKLLILKWDTPVIEIKESEIFRAYPKASNLGIKTPGIQDAPKRVKAIFADPVDNYNTKYCYWPEAPLVSDQSDFDTITIQLIGSANFSQALKLAKFYFLKANLGKQFDFVGHPKLYGLETGEMVKITHDTAVPGSSIPASWNQKVLRIRDCDLMQDNKTSLVVSEEEESTYDDTVNIAAHVAYQTTIPTGEEGVEKPTALSASTGADENTVNLVDAYIEFSWDNMGEGFDYELRFRKPTDDSWRREKFLDPGGEIGIPVPTESGTLLMEADGDYYGTGDKNYRIQIDGVGSPNTFKWSDTGGSSWNATGVPITTEWQDLNNGVKIEFSAFTGGVLNDRWDFIAKDNDKIKLRVGKLDTNKEFYWQVCSIGDKKNRSEWATPASSITTWAPGLPDMSGVELVLQAAAKAVDVHWATYSPPNDVLGYKIYYKAGSPGSFPGDYTLIGTAAKKAVHFKVKKLTAGQTYHFKVLAFNITGDGLPTPD